MTLSPARLAPAVLAAVLAACAASPSAPSTFAVAEAGPGATRSGDGGTDSPGTDSPGTDSPGTDSPGTDSPGTDSPGTGSPGTGGSDAEALAKQLANPVASLISVPIQYNYDEDIGPADGDRSVINVQPVVPISLNEDWNLISRTILPIVDQSDVPPGEDESGIGDVLQSAFFSPVEPTAGGWIWGVGPAFLLPTASDETLGAEKWAIGPTAVALKQAGPWTYGALVNHLWSFAGDDDRTDVSSTFLQPFVSYTTPTAVTYSLIAESTYDWKEDELAVPLNGVVTKVFDFGGQLVSIGGGLRYWAEDTEASPEGLGFRFNVTFLFPR